MVNRWRVLSRLLPAGGCVLCDAKSSGLLCNDCRVDLPRIAAGCDLCARPLPRKGICPHCQRQPPPYRARAFYRYEFPIPLLVQQLKFSGHAGLGAELAGLILENLTPADVPPATALVPMPLHWRRQLIRGFNQALEIARPLAAGLNMPLRPNLCRRVRATKPQAQMAGQQRRRNVSGAFQARPAASLPTHTIIIDDVLTSGYTAADLARCLRRAGVQTVTVWTFARAGLKDYQ